MMDVYVDFENGLDNLNEMIHFMGYPSASHETIISEISKQFGNYLEGKRCRAFGPNTGLNLGYRFNQIEHLESVQVVFMEQIKAGKQNIISLAPDIQVICNYKLSDFDSLGYKGVPKLAIEVYSPSTGYNDYSFKKDIYEAIGISEYWVIRNIENVSVFRLVNGKYTLTKYQTHTGEDILEIPSQNFEGLVIRLNRRDILDYE